MNKTFLLIVISLLISQLASLTGCSSAKAISKIKTNDFNGVSEIKKGESANLQWNFENADKVRITELQRNYNPVDSIKVSPETDSSFNFVITAGKDTLSLIWRVFIKQEDGIATGIISENIMKDKPSFTNSKYLRGIRLNNTNNEVKNLKIMRHNYPFEGMNIVRTKAILLDEFGNYLSGFGAKGSGFITVNATTGCTGNIKSAVVTGFKEFSSDSTLDFALLLDNSSIAGEYFPIYAQIKTFLNTANKNDRFALYNFNQNFHESLPLTPINKISTEDLSAGKPGGLSAIFKSLKYAVEKLSENDAQRPKVLVLVSYSTDNASIIYDRNDIIDLAQSHNIPIYVIGVGNAVDSYSLNSIATLTGARYYEIEENELDNISLILNEILFAQKNHYIFDIPISADQTGGCDIIKVNTEFVTNISNAYDTLSFPSIRNRHEFNYMAVASFEQRDTVVSDDYTESVKILADVMIKNPNISIELIGNASIEGNDKQTYSLGLKRAQAVRRLLIANGADPSKIRVRSEGSNKPLYYLQESTWMQYYNRRVELKWLDPSLLPFEILAQTNDTETEALENVEKWEDRGYRSYYERYLQNNIPVYRVKLWGYSTLAEAEKSAKKLGNDFGLPLTVQ